MVTQSSDVYIIENSKLLFEETKNINISIEENYCIPSKHTFIFNDEKNRKIEKHIIKRLGERKNLWMKKDMK